MFKIDDILSGDFSQYPLEVQEYMKIYTEKLREKIKEELAKDLADRMLRDVDKSNETFMTILTEILNNGCKGFNKMSTRALLNTYLEKKSQEDFFNLLEQINV
jgi:transposase